MDVPPRIGCARCMALNPTCDCQTKEDNRIQTWPHTLVRIQFATRYKSFQFRMVACALAKNDHFSAPSNWDTKGWGAEPKCTRERHREHVIIKWTAWVLRHRKRDAKRIVREYLLQKNPDCTDILVDYFT
jgi:hypothetical protein